MRYFESRVNGPWPSVHRLLIPVSVTLLLAVLSGCSNKVHKVGEEAQDNNGVRIYLSTDPDPLQAGDDRVIVRLTDIATNQPIVNANVTISAYNNLAGGGDRESGRSQGNGEYDVPMKFGIPDTYKLDVEIQRTGQQDSDATFSVIAN